MEDRTFIDSSLVFYGSGSIGYRWAVKVMEIVAREDLRIVADTFLFQEVLDRFTGRGDLDRAEILHTVVRDLFTEVVPVRVEDFDRAAELFRSYPSASPRALLRIATMLNSGARDLCATYSAELERIREINRVNLMENIRT